VRLTVAAAFKRQARPAIMMRPPPHWQSGSSPGPAAAGPAGRGRRSMMMVVCASAHEA
jgi:hypothetical protein